MKINIEYLLSIWKEYNSKSLSSFSMIASENVLSPLASLISVSDFYNRYFFNSEILWGTDSFTHSKVISQIQKDILTPLLKDLTRASYINVSPLSGMNGMTIVMSSYCNPGDTIFIIPPKMGGHVATSVIAKKLNLQPFFIPYHNYSHINYDQLSKDLKQKKCKLIYLDQVNCLFEIDIPKIKEIVKYFFPHSLGHSVGLDVHDVPNPLDLLKINMIVTIEPGIYFNSLLLEDLKKSEFNQYINWDKINLVLKNNIGGVRIEDTILITNNGYINFIDLPTSVNEIEEFMNK